MSKSLTREDKDFTDQVTKHHVLESFSRHLLSFFWEIMVIIDYEE